MTLFSLWNWLNPLAPRFAVCRHRQHRDRLLRARFVPQLEALEDRTVPSTLMVANTADSGEGSLRAALNAAQNGDTIVFAPGLAGTIPLQSALPSLNTSISILGPGADQLTVEGNYPWYNPYPDYRTFFPIFSVGSEGNVQISGLTLTHSSLAAIHNDGSIDVKNCIFTQNFSDRTAAIDNTGSAIINNSTLAGNSIADSTINNTGTLIVSNSIFADNSMADATINNTGTLIVSNSTLSGNYGGAIYNHGSATVNNSTLSGNKTIGSDATYYTTYDGPYSPQSYYTPAGNGLGGGIYMSAGVLSINSSTLANNQAVGGDDSYEGLPGEGYGGSLYIAGGTVSINNSTLAGNQAVGGAGIGSSGIGQGGGIYNAAGAGALQVHNSIIAGNLADIGPDLDGRLISLGHNLIGNAMGDNGFAASDLLDIDPQLGPLQNNGGPTQTLALLSGSRAIDAGDNTNAPAYDQRGPGFPRIVNGTLDIGAFEVQSGSSTQASSVAVAGFPSVISAGVAGTVTVTASNADGTTNTSYRGTVHFTSSDPQAVLPADYTFAAADQGVHTFSVTLKTAGSQSLTASDTIAPSGAGMQTGIAVNPATASNFTVADFPSPVAAGAAGSFTVTAWDAYGNRATGYLGSVHLTSSDTKAVLPANYTFTAADGGMHTFRATLKTAGYQTLTATDTANGTLTATQENIRVTPAAASRLLLTAPANVRAGVRFRLTVIVVDAYGNVITGYRGRLAFRSSDARAQLPGNYTFTAADQGVHAFTGLMLKKKGSQSITAADTLDSSLTGSVTIYVL